jgi:hypothetical protein
MDEGSMGSSDPWSRKDQRQVLWDRRAEDDRATIERRREARRQSDSRAGPAANKPMPGYPGCLPYDIGCPAFTPELRQVRWPSSRGFKPDLPDKYDGKLDPSEFLGIYTIAVQAAGGRDDKVLANYFPLALKPNVRSWLMNLPEGSISSWVDLCHQFVGAYRGGHKLPGQPSYLHVLPQRDGESLRKYIQRFSRVHHNIPDVHPAAVIAAFHTNVHNRRMREEMSITRLKDIGELYTLANKCARAKEGRRLPGEDAGTAVDSEDEDASTSKKKGRKRNRKRKGKVVLAVEESSNPGKKPKAADAGKDVAACTCGAVAAGEKTDGQYCKIHRTKGHDL